MEDLRLAWHWITDEGRLCGLWVMAWSVPIAAALLAAIALILALEPVR